MKSIIKKLWTKKELLLSIVLALWTGAAFFLFQNITFESNDDNSMARIAYGMIGEYDPHLVYINIVVGYIMKFCLQLMPTVPWYTVFQCILVIISFFVIIYLFMCRFGVKKALLPIFILSLLFGSQFFLQMQFSKTAGISCLAGLLLLFDAVKHDSTGKVWKYILGAILTVFGSMYRFNVFGMMLVIFFGIGLHMIWKPLKEKKFKEVFRICIPFILIISICFGLRIFDLKTYQKTEEWKHYREFNSLRAQLLDYGFPEYSENKELYESLNISASDLEMFESWDFADPEIFTTDAMQKLIDAKGKPPVSIGNCVATVKSFFLDYRYSIAVIAAAVVWLLTYKKERLYFFIYSILSVVGLQLYMAINGRYGINRIDVSIACAVFCVLVLYAWGDFKLKEKWLAALLAIAVFFCPFVENDFSKNEPVRFYELLESDKEHLYIRSVSSAIPRIPRTMEIYPVGYQSNSCSLGGWSTYSVPYLTMWDHYDITNPFKDMVDNYDIYLVSTIEPTACLNYIRNHYFPEARVHLVKTTEDGHPLYRVTTTAGPVVDTSVARFVEGEEFTYSAKATVDPNNGNITIKGYFYGADMNSFASNIYVGVKGADGVEQLYFTKQGYASKLKDHMNGAYGKYSCSLPAYSDTTEFTLYLELNNSLYAVNMGAVNRYIEAQ